MVYGHHTAHAGLFLYELFTVIKLDAFLGNNRIRAAAVSDFAGQKQSLGWGKKKQEPH